MIARSRWIPTYACTMLATLVAASAIRAQGWVMLPNGEIGYITNYTTTGFFTCGDPLFSFGTCHAAGNSLTLGNGPNTMTMTFQGLANQFVMATNAQNTRAMWGTINKTFTGPGQFTFPASWNINVPLFYFSIIINSSYPVNGSGTWQAGYLPLSPTSIPKSCCQGWTDWFLMPTAPPPPQAHWGYVFFWDATGSSPMTATGEPIVFSAMPSLMPEPGTVLLTATGCLGLLPLLWRRRRKSSRDT